MKRKKEPRVCSEVKNLSKCTQLAVSTFILEVYILDHTCVALFECRSLVCGISTLT